MKKYIVLIMVIVGFLATGCASKTKSEAWFTKDTKVSIPKPNFENNYHDQQLLKFKYNDQEHSLIILLDAKDDQLKVIGLSALGIRLFELSYTGKSIKTKQNIFIKQLPPPEQVLSDILLSILPLKQWQAVLPQGWKLIDNNYHRQLIDDQQNIIIDISYNQTTSNQIRKPTQIKHNIFGYQISIQSMEAK
ncbi:MULTISPECIES: DUF3261 domain-containing protein [unclassified Gilliamella]|uniref:DUF3261 domain-containing protein n=1 Tax=unclassified Gilliamella TaxID=2685620 RepID=UPI00226984C7|nr:MULTISPECIES: DUF3261 domain-containing protein [unclassified Gilliamella]MCX8601113.1 DUF3261 domain-containing protein [Gilliamella sp. B3722]MCX8607267.1 DUF3261 domain-containing protein [Gilliamella sp. B3771]MCX8610544.1 DUF3261 domain-containing protein [Gilliamella sp. B3891]MCX8612787.1 DUF3261 domain-containing protein [Gilliamella sp. B3773]MCX8614696.1 DUF3261 domain-containing protein [Gilliamella sp. B3770]